MPGRRTVDEDDVDAQSSLRLEVAVVAAGGHDDEAVDVALEQVRDDVLLADDVLRRAADDQRRRRGDWRRASTAVAIAA